MPAPCFVAITLAGMLASGKPAKDARAYLYIGPSTRISPVISTPGERPHARSEITIGPITTFARETPEEVVRAPCVERDSAQPRFVYQLGGLPTRTMALGSGEGAASGTRNAPSAPRRTEK